MRRRSFLGLIGAGPMIGVPVGNATVESVKVRGTAQGNNAAVAVAVMLDRPEGSQRVLLQLEMAEDGDYRDYVLHADDGEQMVVKVLLDAPEDLQVQEVHAEVVG